MTCNCNESNKVERNGHTASCNREQRKLLEQASKVKVIKPVKKVSEKMGKALQEYSKLKKDFLEWNPNCAVYPEKEATDIHHMKGRATIELLLDTDFWLAVSREGHIFIETHPEIAYQKGWSLKRTQTEPHKI